MQMTGNPVNANDWEPSQCKQQGIQPMQTGNGVSGCYEACDDAISCNLRLPLPFLYAFMTSTQHACGLRTHPHISDSYTELYAACTRTHCTHTHQIYTPHVHTKCTHQTFTQMYTLNLHNPHSYTHMCSLHTYTSLAAVVQLY
jgi:hypothetical protein